MERVLLSVSEVWQEVHGIRSGSQKEQEDNHRKCARAAW